MAGLEVVGKRKVDHRPISIQSDLQFICADPSTTDRELIEVAGDGR